MLWYPFIIGVLIGYGFGIDVSIGPNQEPFQLNPIRGAENRWNFTTISDSKLVLRCNIRAFFCDDARVTVDAGGEISTLCGRENPLLTNVSINNNMIVTIENNIREMVVFCDIQATIPYLNVVQPDIDSSEDGSLSLPRTQAPTCPCGWANRDEGRIVNGNVAAINEYPFIVQLMEMNGHRFCGGSILTARHILTAAHCTFNRLALNILVVIGEHDITTGDETPATRVIRARGKTEHVNYNNNNFANDIAVLTLEASIEFNNRVARVCLPTRGAREQNLIGEFIKIIGWGLTDDESIGGQASTVLRKVYTSVIDPSVCSLIYNNDQRASYCTYNTIRSACQGDSGGPLIKINQDINRYVQVGIVSFGRKLCASTDPDVAINVGHYLQWINQAILDSPFSDERVCN